MSSDEMKRRRDFYADHPVDGELESMYINVLFHFILVTQERTTFLEAMDEDLIFAL